MEINYAFPPGDECTERCAHQPPNSCNCSTPSFEVPIRSGDPSSLALRNCRVNPPLGGCHNEEIFASRVSPPNPTNGKHDSINPQVLTQKYAPNFMKIEGRAGAAPVWTAIDPRLISAGGHFGLCTALDLPPIDGSVRLKNVYDEYLRGYGKNYSGYNDINAGQIMYWTDETFDSPTFEPVFSNSAEVTGTVYVDPMGGIKPQYYRKPLTATNPTTTRNTNYGGELSWIQDSQEQREDIISKQQIPTWQSDWSYRWRFR